MYVDLEAKRSKQPIASNSAALSSDSLQAIYKKWL
jgi:hypothetical protein